MKKSPLSTPTGSHRGKNPYSRKTYDNRGYDCKKSDSNSQYYSNNSNDFIPLNISTPKSEKIYNRPNHGNNKYSESSNSLHPRFSNNTGINHYKNNYHSSPKPFYNNTFSPYKSPRNSFPNQKKNFFKIPHREVDISNYVNIHSFLEDPWSSLMDQYNETTKLSEQKLLAPSIKNAEPRIQESLRSDDSDLSQELIKKDSSIDTSLELNDLESSRVLTSANSSIDLKLDCINFSQESQSSNDDPDSHTAGKTVSENSQEPLVKE